MIVRFVVDPAPFPGITDVRGWSENVIGHDLSECVSVFELAPSHWSRPHKPSIYAGFYHPIVVTLN